LDAALKRVSDENVMDIAEALIIRIELAESSDDPIKVAEYRLRLSQLAIPERDLALLCQKHETLE
jgi:hypothetical protein